MPIGVVVALKREAHLLGLKHVEMGKVVSADGVAVCVGGMGALHAERAAEVLVKLGVNVLVSWGCAGGLVDDLEAGSLLVPARVIGADGVELVIDEVWRNKLLQALQMPADGRPIVESRIAVNSKTEKRRLADTSGGVAVDMESAAVLRVAQRHGLPGLVLRAVADSCHDSLPASLDGALNPLGEICGLRFAANLLRHPADLAALWPLKNRFDLAAATLRRTSGVLGKL
ncbi:MAG: hypothetical protein K8Q92_01210 [Methylophilales bacterium]|nr:hypothetical protein [Methylophilales bacterium]